MAKIETEKLPSGIAALAELKRKRQEAYDADIKRIEEEIQKQAAEDLPNEIEKLMKMWSKIQDQHNIILDLRPDYTAPWIVKAPAAKESVAYNEDEIISILGLNGSTIKGLTSTLQIKYPLLTASEQNCRNWLTKLVTAGKATKVGTKNAVFHVAKVSAEEPGTAPLK